MQSAAKSGSALDAVPDDRIYWVVGIMIVAGLAGGVVSYLREESEKEAEAVQLPDGAVRSPSMWRQLTLNIGLSMIAAFLVPLFLGIIQSAVLTDVMKPDAAWVQNLLIFGGFCLVAAITARTFISSVSARVLRMAKEANAEAKNAAKVAEEARDEALEASSQLDEEELPQETEAKLATQDETEYDLSSNEEEVLSALYRKFQVRRSVSGIKADVGLDRGTVQDVLNSLRGKDLVVSHESRKDHLPRYKLSGKGLVAVQKFLSGSRRKLRPQ